MERLSKWQLLYAGEVNAHVRRNGVVGIQEFLHSLKDTEINIALTGESGVGKSSFINAIRRLDDDDDNAAEVGFIKSTTVPTCYTHPNNDKIKLWYLPGIGTPTNPTFKIYCNNVNLERYDTFLIFSGSRLTTFDLELAMKINSLRKSFFFIRTKIDQDIRNERRMKSFNEEALLKNIRDDCSNNLGDLVQNIHDIFLISNHHPAKWDFDRLTQAIVGRYFIVLKMADLEFRDPDVQAHVERKGFVGIEELIKRKLEGWREIEINIAITGDTGNGKSSFINAIRGIADDDDNAAEVDVIECTTKPTSYAHPSNDTIKFWDLPGIGSRNYPTLEIYCSKVKLESYDTFLIFTANRFTNYDLELAKKIRSLSKSFLFIRTKIDQAVSNERRKKSFNEEVVLKKIRDDCWNNLGDLVQSSRDIFLISNHDPAKWEFDRLTQAIKDHTYVKANGVVGMEELYKKLQGWKEIEINMALTGFSGSGKSTFINAIRGVADDDVNAAEVGVTECTAVPTCYTHPNNDKIKLWDLPGIGTPDYPTLKIYCRSMQLESYDTFLIFTANPFTQYCLELTKKIRSLNKSFLFIRTKIDQDVSNERRKKSFNEEVVLNKIRNDCRQNLGDLVQNSRDIFLISSHYPAKWEFARVTQVILDVLPIRQRETFSVAFCSDTLKKNVAILRDRIGNVADASAAVAAVDPLSLTINRVDFSLSLMVHEVKFYRSQLGLPEEGSAMFSRLSVDTQEKCRRSIPTTATIVSEIKKAQCLKTTMGRVWSRFFYTVPELRSPFRITYDFLQRYLTDMEKIAIAVLNEIAVPSADD